MSEKLKDRMAAATRLTREGRLQEAMAMLRGTPPAEPAPHASTHQHRAHASPEPDQRPHATPFRRPRPAGLHARPSLRERVPLVVPLGARYESREFSGAAGTRQYASNPRK